MEIIVIVATALSIVINVLLTYFVISNNKKYAKKYNELRSNLDDSLKVAVDSINGEGAAQTEIIKQKSGEEQAMLEHMQEEVSHKIDVLLTELRATARSIHLDVHDNLKNIVFDNFASREDKVKSRVLDSLGYAIKYAAHDQQYMRELLGILDKGDVKVKKLAEVAREQDGAKKEKSVITPQPSETPAPTQKPAEPSAQSAQPIKEQPVVMSYADQRLSEIEEALKAYDRAVPAQDLNLPPLEFKSSDDLETQLQMLAELRKQN